MSGTGTSFGILALRLTENRKDGSLGRSIVRSGRFTFALTPVIETGTELVENYPDSDRVFARYRGPDQFKYFELEIQDRRRFRILDWRFRRMFRRKVVSVETWTRHESPDDDRHPYIHWLFPYVSWERREGRYLGETWDGPPRMHPEIPDGQPVSQGAFWKTDVPPPVMA